MPLRKDKPPRTDIDTLSALNAFHVIWRSNRINFHFAHRCTLPAGNTACPIQVQPPVPELMRCPSGRVSHLNTGTRIVIAKQELLQEAIPF